MDTTDDVEVIEMTVAEHECFLNQESWSRLRLTIGEFRHLWLAGELDDSDPDVGLMATLAAPWRW